MHRYAHIIIYITGYKHDDDNVCLVQVSIGIHNDRYLSVAYHSQYSMIMKS